MTQGCSLLLSGPYPSLSEIVIGTDQDPFNIPEAVHTLKVRVRPFVFCSRLNVDVSPFVHFPGNKPRVIINTPR